jgi:hypothetical protein
MLEHMKVQARNGAALLMLLAAIPGMADTRFQIRRMTRDDVPAGKGQCDIRLQVDNQVEVAVRGDFVEIRTIAGRDARDDGSECNAALPRGPVQGFNFEVKDSRGDIRLVAEPSRRNDWAAVVAIRDNSGGEGRYHFRLSWMLAGNDRTSPRREDEFNRARPGEGGFSWNNTISFRGDGRGTASLSGFGDLRLGQVNLDVDRSGKIVAVFRVDRGRPLTYSGQVMVQENGRWKADMMSEDRRLRGPMWFSVDDRGQVNSVTLEATDGRDRMRLNWDRR